MLCTFLCVHITGLYCSIPHLTPTCSWFFYSNLFLLSILSHLLVLTNSYDTNACQHLICFFVINRMFPYIGYNTSLDRFIPSSFKCGKWGTADGRFLLDPLFGRPNYYSCSTKWIWNFLASSVCGNNTFLFSKSENLVVVFPDLLSLFRILFLSYYPLCWPPFLSCILYFKILKETYTTLASSSFETFGQRNIQGSMTNV